MSIDEKNLNILPESLEKKRSDSSLDITPLDETKKMYDILLEKTYSVREILEQPETDKNKSKQEQEEIEEITDPITKSVSHESLCKLIISADSSGSFTSSKGSSENLSDSGKKPLTPIREERKRSSKKGKGR